MKAALARIYKGILAGLSTPGAVRAEKSLAAIVVVRAVIAIGGTTVTAELVARLLSLT